MSVQKSSIIIVGQLWKYNDFKKVVEESTGKDIFDVIESIDFSNFESDHKKNMDRTLKCIFDGMNGTYVILGIPLHVSYEEADFGIFTFDQNVLDSVKKDVLIELFKNNFHTILKTPDFDIKMHCLTHYS